MCSPRLGIGLLGTAALSALESCLKREGVQVVVAYSGEPPGSMRDRRRLADERPRLRKLVEAGLDIRIWNSHAKILIADDEVVIGSFNYLSFEGYYDKSRRARHELSVRVRDRALADAVWELMMSESSTGQV